MRVVTETKRGHGPWAKKVQTTEVIDLENLFNDYWSSNAREITVSGQLQCPSNLPAANTEASAEVIVVGTRNGSLALHFSAKATVCLFATPIPAS